MLVGRLPLQSGSIAGCWIGVAKSMCSVMLEMEMTTLAMKHLIGREKEC